MTERAEKNEWYKSENSQPVYFGSCVSLFRNLSDIPFKNRMKSADAEKVLNIVKKAVSGSEEYDYSEFNDFFNEKYPFYDKVRFTEEWKISKDFLDEKMMHALVTDGKNLFVSVNDSEHLEIKALFAGNALNEAYECAKKFEQTENLKNEYAYSNEFGYLTSDPMLVGTGLKASVILNVPAICLFSAFGEFDEIADKMNVEVSKPFNGAEPKYTGIIKISNKTSIDTDCGSVIASVSDAAGMIAALEEEKELELTHNRTGNVDDVLWRALGTLKYARSITFKEALRCISMVSLGIRTGIINEKENFCMAEPVFSLRHGGLSGVSEKKISQTTENEARAEYLRKYFSK